MNEQHAEDVASATGAVIFNDFDALAELPACERYNRLKLYVLTALAAYFEFAEQRAVPEPSRN